MYPYNEYHSFDESDVNKLNYFRLPQEYTYTTVESNIFAKEGTYPANSAHITAIPVKSHYINNHLFVDLGLPSGVLWANANIGAEKVADAGDYYAWGETETKESYNLSGYKYYADNAYTKYTYQDKRTTLENSDDVAYVKWGNSCRMPTEAELEELISTDNTKWEWTTKTDSKGKTIGGIKITSNKNGNSIFLPAAGYLIGSTNQEPNSNYGNYWSNTYKTNKEATTLRFNSSVVKPWSSTYWDRSYGLPVRPVAVEN